MAKYKSEATAEEVTNTLFFRGHAFTEKWEDSGIYCRKPILGKVEDTFPDLPDEVLDAIDNLCDCSNPSEASELLTMLEDYEDS